jgi:hypothetical protein
MKARQRKPLGSQTGAEQENDKLNQLASREMQAAFPWILFLLEES